MTDEQIDDVERRGAVQPRITLNAPIDGVVVELAAREGMTVTSGDTLFRINGLSTVWVTAAVPESQAAFLRPGVVVQAGSPALAGVEFSGTLQAILPDVDVATRTIGARVELDNRDRALVPGMFVSVTLGTDGADTLAVPTEAVIRTGTRTVVIVEDDSGAFRPVDVEIGIEVGGQTEIRRGLDVGQRVVISGQFLLDSEASLRATSTRMQDALPSNAPPVEHEGEGRITAIGQDTVTLAHGPIPTLQWGSMTMEFILPPGSRADLRVDEQVRFAFSMGEDGKPRLTRIERSAQ
jgi:Cu(I)/Ag(I) efflux system membrane fusion protein